MDALEQLSGVGGDLLRRVDTLLAEQGAPAGDPVWGLLRRVGSLPGDALDFGLRLEPGPLRAAAAELRADADRFAHGKARIDSGLGAGGWEGVGAEGFGVLWTALGDHTDDICARLAATAGYAEALAGWSERLRYELAEAIARVVMSAEAVVVRTGAESLETVLAAARIGARVLRPVADAVGEVRDLETRWAPDLTPLRWVPPAAPQAGGTTPIMRVDL